MPDGYQRPRGLGARQEPPRRFAPGIVKTSSRWRKTDAAPQTELLERAQDAIGIARELVELRVAQAEKVRRYVEYKLITPPG